MSSRRRRGAAALALGSGLAALGCAAEHDGAKVASQVAVVREEQSPDKLVERGRAFAEIGDLTRAEQYLSAAIDSGANADVVLPMLLRVCISEQRYWVAIDYAEPHLRRRPDDYRLRFVVASLYEVIGDTKMARAHLERVLDDKPEYADAHYAIAVLIRDGEHDVVGADAHFREYLRLEPKGLHAEEARGSLLKTIPASAPTPAPAPAPASEGPAAAEAAAPVAADGSKPPAAAPTPRAASGAPSAAPAAKPAGAPVRVPR